MSPELSYLLTIFLVYLFVAFACIFIFYDPRDESESVLFGIGWPIFLSFILMISPFLFVSYLAEKWHYHKEEKRRRKTELEKIKANLKKGITNPHV